MSERYRSDIGAYSHFIAVFDGDKSITEEEAAARLNEQDAEIEELKRCLNAANKQYAHLEAAARRACDGLEEVVLSHYAIHEPPPAVIEEVYDALHAELNPPESEPLTN